MGEMARLRALRDQHLAYDLEAWHPLGLRLLLVARDARVRRMAAEELRRRRWQ